MGGLGYSGENFTEFKEINDYLDEKIDEFKNEGLTADATKLLSVLAKDVENSGI